MSRSRAFNRSHRITAKKRRMALRSCVHGLKEESRKSFDHTQALRDKASHKDILVDLIEPEVAS